MAVAKKLTGRILDGSGNPQSGVVQAQMRTLAFVNNGEVVPRVVLAIADATGNYAFDPAATVPNGLYSNADMTPANSYWTIQHVAGGVPYPSFAVVIPNTAGPFAVTDPGIVVSSPALPAQYVVGPPGGPGASGAPGAGYPTNFVTKTTTYLAVGNDYVQADATGGAFTVTLPATPATGTIVAVKKIDATAGVVTIAPSGGGSIDGDPSASTATQWAGAVFEHVGANVWRVTASMTTTGPAGPTGPTGPAGPTGATGATGAAGTSGMLPGQALGVETRSGGFYMALPGALINNLTPGNGYLAAGPIYFSKAVTLDRIGIQVTQAAAATFVRLGIYNDDGSMYPSTLRLDAGQIDSSTTGGKEIVISHAIGPGVFWLGACQQGAGTLIEGTQNAPVILPVPLIANIGPNSPSGFADNGGNAGALPASLVVTYSQVACPRVFVRVS